MICIGFMVDLCCIFCKKQRRCDNITAIISWWRCCSIHEKVILDEMRDWH